MFWNSVWDRWQSFHDDKLTDDVRIAVLLGPMRKYHFFSSTCSFPIGSVLGFTGSHRTILA
jgi:hypothetical protein